MNQNLSIISDICRAHHFKKRGRAFFRVCGDGVLQVLKYSFRQHPFHEEIIKVGLFSLYSELWPQWFTSSGCIPRYNTLYLKTPHWEYMERFTNAPVKRENVIEGVLTFHLDISMLEDYIFPFLDPIQDQKRLADGIIHLFRSSYNRKPAETDPCICWSDSFLIAPFLKSNRPEYALRVAEWLLELHASGAEQKRLTMTAEEFKQYQANSNESVAKLERYRTMILNGDEPVIQEYLQKNYEANCKLARFCM